MNYNIKLSSSNQGLNLKEISKEQAIEIIEALIGTQGIKRISVEWEHPEDPDPKVNTSCTETIDQTKDIKYPTQECEISDTTAPISSSEPPLPPREPPRPPQTGQDGPDEPGRDNRASPPANAEEARRDEPHAAPGKEPPQQTQEPYIFVERKRISKKALGTYIDIGVKYLGYHQQPNGDDIVLCFGTTKVYTSISDIDKLSESNDPAETANLNINKQIAIRRFKRYCMENEIKPSGDS